MTRLSESCTTINDVIRGIIVSSKGLPLLYSLIHLSIMHSLLSGGLLKAGNQSTVRSITTWAGAPWARINLTFHPVCLLSILLGSILHHNHNARPIPFLRAHTTSIRPPNPTLRPTPFINHHRSLPCIIHK